MYKLLLKSAAALCLAVCLSICAPAQMTTITASNIKMNGTPVATGQVLFTAVDHLGTAIAFSDGTGSLNSPGAFTCSITAGALSSCSIPDSSQTVPANVLYQIQVINTATNKSFTLQAVTGVSGATWALDHYGPAANTTAIQTIAIQTLSFAPATGSGVCVNNSFYIYTGPNALYSCISGSWVMVSGGNALTIGKASGQAADGAAALTNRGAYSSGTTYAINDVVQVGSSSFISLIASNTGNAPATSPSDWTAIASPFTGGTLTSPLFPSEDPQVTAPLEAENLRHALRSTDWAARIQWFHSPRPNITLNQVPTNLYAANYGESSPVSFGVTLPANAVVRHEGCPASQITTGTSFPVAGFAWCATAQSYTRLMRWTTVVSSDSADFLLLSQAAPYRVWVDGVASGYFQNTTNDGSIAEFRVVFGDGKSHELSVETSGKFGGFLTPNGTSDLAAPTTPVGPKVAIFGNSITEPTITGSFNGNVGFVYVASELLGWKNYTDYGEGGTDYIATDSGARVNYLGHMAGSDGCADTFDVYFFSGGGINDTGNSATAEQAAAYSTYQAAHTCSPNAKIIVLGQIPGMYQAATSTAAVELGIQNAVAQAQTAGLDITYIGYPSGEGWNVVNALPSECATISNGPINCVSSGDGTHPSQIWHEDFGISVAERVVAAVPWVTNWVNTNVPLPESFKAKIMHRHPEITGTWTFSSSSATVTSTNGNALAELKTGDIIFNCASDGTTGIPFTVASVSTNNSFTLTATPPSYWTCGGSPVQIQLGSTPWQSVAGALPNGKVATKIGGLADVTPANGATGCWQVQTANGPTVMGTCGTGAVTIVASSTVTGQTGAVSNSTIFTATTAGLYTFKLFAWTTSAGTAGTVYPSLNIGDGTGTRGALTYGGQCGLDLTSTAYGTGTATAPPCNVNAISIALPAVYLPAGGTLQLSFPVSTAITGSPQYSYSYEITD